MIVLGSCRVMGTIQTDVMTVSEGVKDDAASGALQIPEQAFEPAVHAGRFERFSLEETGKDQATDEIDKMPNLFPLGADRRIKPCEICEGGD